MKKRKRLTPDERFEQIIKAALCLAERTHFYYMKMCDVAKKAKCSESLVRHYLGSVPIMRLRVLDEAVKRKNLTVINHGKDWDMITPKGKLRSKFKERIKSA
jgi:hypothetical protein